MTPRVLSCRLKSDVFRGILLSKQDQLGNICFSWFPSAMLVPIQVGTSMASPYNSLCIWVKHFFGYLFWQSWRGTLYIYLLSFPRFWTLFVNLREYRQIHTPTPWYKRLGGGGDGTPPPSFWYVAVFWNNGCYLGRHLGFYQELEIRFKLQEMVFFVLYMKNNT